MNKLIALFATVIAFSANVEAANRKAKNLTPAQKAAQTRAAKQAAKNKNAGEAKQDEAPAKEDAKQPEAPVQDQKAPAQDNDTNKNAPTESSKFDAVVQYVQENKVKSAVAGTAAVAVVGLGVDLAVRGKKSLLGRTYAKVMGKNAQYSKIPAQA